MRRGAIVRGRDLFAEHFVRDPEHLDVGDCGSRGYSDRRKKSRDIDFAADLGYNINNNGGKPVFSCLAPSVLPVCAVSAVLKSGMRAKNEVDHG